MTDINARIAEKKGWTYERCVVCNGKHWYDNVKYIQKNPPDYTTDWRLAGELLEEIGHKSSVINVQADHTGYAVYVRKYPTDTAKLIMYHADTPQMAIALAWLEWSEG